MKKKLLVLILLAVIIAAAAAVFVFPPLGKLREADTLFTGGAYKEAREIYGFAATEKTFFFFKDRAEAGLADCAQAALEAGDESFIEYAVSDACVIPQGKAAAERFSAALEGTKQVRADREEAERLAEEERLRKEEEARIAAEEARIAEEKARIAAEEAAVRERQQERAGEYEAAVASHDHLLALSVITSMESEDDRTAYELLAAKARTVDTAKLRKAWQKRFGAGTWYTAVLSDTLKVQGDPRYDSDTMPQADSMFAGDFGVLLINGGVPSFYGDTLGADKEIGGMTDIVSGSVGMNHALLVHADGTVTPVGAKQYHKAEVTGWSDITAVAAGAFHSVGLDKRGFVVTAGLNADKQLETSRWRNIVAVGAGMRHTVGLLSDGHVVAAGDNSFGQCEVSGWTDIVAIACGANHTVGLKKDGTVVAAGDNSAGQCEVKTWSHVLALGAGTWHTAALLEDGRVIAAGSNENGQCDTEDMRAFRVTEYALTPETVHGPSDEYVYVQDEKNGPWVYYSKEGAVVISLEDQYELVATRADLFCTAGVYPEGLFSGGGDVKPKGTSMGTTLAKQNHAVFAINGDYFDFGYNPDGVQIRRGTVFKNVVSDNLKSRGVAFWPDNTLRLVDPMKIDAQALVDLGIRDSWVFGPLLILDGEEQDISYSPLSYNDVTLRSAIGSICACHHIALSCGRATLAEVTKLFLDYGCDIAYNLDGGRSVWMTFMGQRVNRTYFNKSGTRNLSDMIGFLHSPKVK